MNQIHYQKLPTCWKYKLNRDYLHILPDSFREQKITIKHKYFSINLGVLKIRTDYCWDGASGPTVDTQNLMRGSLVHDVLYQCIRLGFLDDSYYSIANKEFYRILREDGMSWFRAQYFYQGVKLFGENWNEIQKNTEKVNLHLVAPKD